jgi:hypothetical protein
MVNGDFTDRSTLAMKRLIALAGLVTLTLAGCGGGSNAGNASSPVATSAHTPIWVTYHRFPTTESFSNNGAEALNQCKVCHGTNLLGAAEGAGAPACLSCHVVDPVPYPERCYSCHGSDPVKPFFSWYSTMRSTRNGMPIDPAFVQRVRNGSLRHLKHDAVPPAEMENPDACLRCHAPQTEFPDRPLPEIHHKLVFTVRDITGDGIPELVDCTSCHVYTIDPELNIPIRAVRDCVLCHPTIVR